MLCLGIESSCDETALALVRDGELVDSLLASQVNLHAIFGGVVPELASREHYRYMGPLFDELFQRTGLDPHDIDAIAIARGPGLLGSLLVGSAFAKGLALALGKPLLGINHLHAHLLANGLERPLQYPALGLLVSGGHTNIYLVNSPTKFIQLGKTLDDAAGEALDKTGAILGLPYPAGKTIDKLASQGMADKKLLPRPNAQGDNLDFSFSGLKTAAATHARQNALNIAGEGESQKIRDFCASLNTAVVETLTNKLKKALCQNPQIKSLWLAGGVAANSMLRQELEKLAIAHNLAFAVPRPNLCTDNAAMIAYAGWLLHKEGYSHSLTLEAIPRGKKMPEDMLKK